MIVRWLLAFEGQGNYSLHEAIEHELTRSPGDWVAAEPLRRGKALVPGNIGLRVAPGVEKKCYRHDCFSKPLPDGRLTRTRCGMGKPTKDHHGEAFVPPIYDAIVIKKNYEGEEIWKKYWNTAKYWAKKTGLPIIKL